MATKHGGKRSGTGPKITKTSATRRTVGSIRLNAEEWKLFAKWGGAERLRETLAKVKAGVARQA